MVRPGNELADIIRRFGPDFIKQCNPNSFELRTLDALSACRTAALGGHIDQCDDCHAQRNSYNSCRNRHCPKCLASKQAFWVEDLLLTTINVKHYHIVFTLPHELNRLCMLDTRHFYNVLFASVWDTLKTFGYSHFGVETGAICMLHTWGQNLSLHPHVHCIVPAAGLKLNGKMKHISEKGNFLFPVRQLGAAFKSRCMLRIKQYLVNENLLLLHKAVVDSVWKKDWVVYCEPALGKAEQVIQYLGQYTHRVAISNHRILSIDEHGVTFMHKDYSNGARQKPVTLSGVEFLRRFCQHILPHGFVKIRRYGIYSTRMRTLQKIHCPAKMTIPVRAPETVPERIKRLLGFDVYLCPFCKKGRMHVLCDIPRVRSPTVLWDNALLMRK
jgi:hypothetical protein